MTKTNRYKVEVKGDYIRLETWGELHEEDLAAPAEAALAMREKSGVNKLLDDIRGVDPGPVSVTLQAKGVGILWKLRVFKKVAIVFSGKEIGWLFLSTLQAMHLNEHGIFKGFDNEAEATAWLQEE